MDQSKGAAGAAALLLACVLGASSAFASDPYGQVRTEDIKFEDLNLATTAPTTMRPSQVRSRAARAASITGRKAPGAR
jgi:hypothetical protein